MQIGRIGEWPKPCGDVLAAPGVVGKVDLERRAQLHAPDADPGALQLAQCRGGILVLDSEVAAVETELHVLLQLALGFDRYRQPSAVASIRAPASNSQSRKNVTVSAVFSRTQSGSGSMSRWMTVPCSRRTFTSASTTRTTLRRDRFPCGRIRDIHPGFVGERRRRDAAVHSCGQERLEDPNQIERVLDPRIVAPVWRVDARLDRRAVEVAVREAIDHGDVQAVVIQEFPELLQPVAAQQLPRLARRESQTNTERRVGREARFERRRVRSKIGEHALPAVGGVDVGAVSQVEGGNEHFVRRQETGGREGGRSASYLVPTSCGSTSGLMRNRCD